MDVFLEAAGLQSLLRKITLNANRPQGPQSRGGHMRTCHVALLQGWASEHLHQGP